MMLRIELVTHCGRDNFNAVLLEHAQQLAHRQLDPFQQGAGDGALLFCSGFQCALHIVVDRQHVACQFRPAIVFRLATVLVRPFARILCVGQGPHETVFQLVTLGTQFVQFQRFVVNFGHLVGIGFGLCVIDIIQKFVLFRLCHNSPLAAVRNQLSNQLRRVIHNRHDTSIIKARGADHTDRPDHLTISVHIRGNDQRGTRK